MQHRAGPWQISSGLLQSKLLKSCLENLAGTPQPSDFGNTVVSTSLWQFTKAISTSKTPHVGNTVYSTPQHQSSAYSAPVTGEPGERKKKKKKKKKKKRRLSSLSRAESTRDFFPSLASRGKFALSRRKKIDELELMGARNMRRWRRGRLLGCKKIGAGRVSRRVSSLPVG